MRFRFGMCVLALVAIAGLLAGCGFSTDTAATVGGETITRGEFQQATADGSTTLTDLINDRILLLEARAQGVTISDAQVNAQIGDDLKQTEQAVQQQHSQALDALASSAAQQLRPIVNAHGGTALADADLVKVVRQQIDVIQQALDARPAGFASDVPDRLVNDQAIGLTNAFSAQGFFVPPQELAPTVGQIAQQLNSPQNNVTTADTFQQNLAQLQFTSASYMQNTRRQLLSEALRPSWYKPQVEALTLQLLVADNQAKAQEAVQKGRAGMNFDDLVKTYASANAQSPQVVNSAGSIATEGLNPSIRSSFPAIKEGEYSEPFLAGSSGQYAVVRIAKVEQRAPTAREEQALLYNWLHSLYSKYHVTINEAVVPLEQRPQ
ncbi:MAG TPA: hypothetical protein VFU78_09120 [Thermomicrobiales bacterium]|nr:hypothetical protein [Thermomicrobiales bacterium]